MNSKPEQSPLTDAEQIIFDNQQSVIEARQTVRDSLSSIKKAISILGAEGLHLPLEIDLSADREIDISIFALSRIEDGIDTHAAWQLMKARFFAKNRPLQIDAILGSHDESLLLTGKNSEGRAFYVELDEQLIPLLRPRSQTSTEI